MPGTQRTIGRDCMNCGEIIEITVYEDEIYEGGHYFGDFTVPDEESEGAQSKRLDT